MYDILTIGSATQDVFLVAKGSKIIASKQFSTGKGECFALGSKFEVARVVFDTGGGATNAAVTFARAGLDVSIFCRIGNDPAGAEVTRVLHTEHIDTQAIFHDPHHSTAYATILLTPNGERTILVYRGASSHFHWNEFPRSAKTKWLYITSLAGDHAFFQRLMDWAITHRMCVAWNPGAQELAWGPAVLKRYGPSIAVLNLNREEAALATKASANDIKQLLHGLRRIAPHAVVIITDGANGAWIMEKDHVLSALPTKHRAINATGAGDAFGSAFVTALIKEKDTTTALRLGIYNSGSVVSHMGAKTGIFKKMPSIHQLSNIRVASL